MTQVSRRWFQFHLATVLVVTLVAGLVLGLELNVGIEMTFDNSHEYFVISEQGFPWTYSSETVKYGVVRDADGEQTEPVVLDEKNGFDVACIALDGAVVGLSLLAVSFAAELLLRRASHCKRVALYHRSPNI